ncbi:MAG: cytochrome C [Pseudomonadota bacterium]
MLIRRLFAVLLLVVPTATFADLPEGAGKAEIETACVACHRLSLIERSSGYTEPEWRELLLTMIELPGDIEPRIVSYLTEHFPPNDNRTPKLIAGPLEISFESWKVPTLGQRSRDPVQAPDGGIWWVGQRGNILGRIDPASGAMKEWALPERAFPHSANVAPDGKIWYLGNGNGTVGVLDPETDEISEYRMPIEAAKDPHTGEFDQRGRFWFTLQRSNMVGRIDPATDEIELVTVPRERSRPYGIKIADDGSAWVACNGGPCLYHLDADDMTVEQIDLPNQESHVRRLDIANDDTIWYVNSGAGRLGNYDPKARTFREWPSPSGPKSHPYGIVIAGGAIWYNESGMRPDPLVRFDPESETFQSWAIPSGGVYAGILRHTRLDNDGNLLIHQSSSNYIIRVDIDPGPGRPSLPVTPTGAR